jgi:hypothetical protein
MDAPACNRLPPGCPPSSIPAEPGRSCASALIAPFSIPESCFPWQTRQWKRNTPAPAAAKRAAPKDPVRRSSTTWMQIVACLGRRRCKPRRSTRRTISAGRASPLGVTRGAEAARARPRSESSSRPSPRAQDSPERSARAPQAAPPRETSASQELQSPLAGHVA